MVCSPSSAPRSHSVKSGWAQDYSSPCEVTCMTAQPTLSWVGDLVRDTPGCPTRYRGLKYCCNSCSFVQVSRQQPNWCQIIHAIVTLCWYKIWYSTWRLIVFGIALETINSETKTDRTLAFSLSFSPPDTTAYSSYRNVSIFHSLINGVAVTSRPHCYLHVALSWLYNVAQTLVHTAVKGVPDVEHNFKCKMTCICK